MRVLGQSKILFSHFPIYIFVELSEFVESSIRTQIYWIVETYPGKPARNNRSDVQDGTVCLSTRAQHVATFHSAV